MPQLFLSCKCQENNLQYNTRFLWSFCLWQRPSLSLMKLRTKFTRNFLLLSIVYLRKLTIFVQSPRGESNLLSAFETAQNFCASWKNRMFEYSELMLWHPLTYFYGYKQHFSTEKHPRSSPQDYSRCSGFEPCDITYVNLYLNTLHLTASLVREKKHPNPAFNQVLHLCANAMQDAHHA